MDSTFNNRGNRDQAYSVYREIANTIWMMTDRVDFMHWVSYGDSEDVKDVYLFNTQEFVDNFNELYKLQNTQRGRTVIGFTKSNIIGLLNNSNKSELSNNWMDMFKIDVVNGDNNIRVEYLNV